MTQASNDNDAFPLSYEQQKIWFQRQINPASSAYNVTELFRVIGPIDLDILSLALSGVVRQHEGLNVCFQELDGKTVQTPLPPGLINDSLLRRHPAVADEKVAVCLLESLTSEPMDLQASPPLRFDIVKLAHDAHVIGFCFHHIVYDGWSATLFFDELSALYLQLLGGDTRTPSRKARSYRKYVQWQRSEKQSGTIKNHNKHWESYLRDVPPWLNLSIGQRRSRVFSPLGGNENIDIPAETHLAVQNLASRQGVSSFCVYLTVFGILLQRYSGQNDFCIGFPSVNRSMPDSESIIGMFTNTLVHRFRSDGSDRFVDLLSSNYDRLLDAQDHESVQLEKVLESLQIRRDASYNPLFQVIFAMQDRRGGSLRLAGADVQPLIGNNTTAKLDLSLLIDVDDSGARGILEYAKSMFSAANIIGLWRHFLQLLDTFCADPRQETRHPALRNSGIRRARDTGLVQANGPEGELLHHWFDRTARAHPHGIAIKYGPEVLSYGELLAQSDALRRRLQQHGAKPGELIGLALPRSTPLVVAILAILKSGCGYLPLDPNYPRERLDFMIQDSGCKLIIVADRLCAPLSEGVVRLIGIDEASEPSAETNTPDIEEAPQIDVASALAYCIYTSGSTGKPKGVLVSHHNVTRLFTQTSQWFGFDRHDVWTMFHSPSFDFSVWEIFGALLHGGTLIVLPYEITRSPEELRRLLKQERVTVLNQTPSAFQQLSASEMSEYGKSDRLEALRCIIFGGETLNVQSLAPWIGRYGDDRPRLINMYGITETTVHVTYRRVLRGDLAEPIGSLIGTPIPDLRLHLLDEGGNAVPDGAIGEIHVGGAGVAIGYHAREQLNRERFVSKRLADGSVQRLYKSGDLARRRDDGDLEYLGRADHQVKLRGYRIETGEIAAELLRNPEIAQAVVLIRPSTQGKPDQLVAWVVAAVDAAVDAEKVRRKLTAVMPSFMVPHNVLLVDRIPLTQNGKVDATALLLVPSELPRSSSVQGSVSPQQDAMLKIWQKVLDIGDIGIHDNFFAIGGDSILAVMVATHCKQDGLQICVADILDCQTVSELCERLREHVSATSAVPALDPVTASTPDRIALLTRLKCGWDVYPVSGMQATMFEQYARHAGNGQGIYHVQQVFHLQDPHPDSDAMAKALAQIVVTFPALRTRALRTERGEWLQCFVAGSAPFVVHDFTRLSPEAQVLEIERQATKDRCHPFAFNDLTGALLRVYWFQLSATRFSLLIAKHHGIDDGWGNQVFLERLFKLYLIAKRGALPEAREQANVMLEYVALERLNVQDIAHQSFWPSAHPGRDAEHLVQDIASAAALRVPFGFQLDARLTASLHRSAKERQITLKALLVAALQASARATWTERAPLLGVVMNGRKEQLSDPLGSLGLFWNMLALARPNGHFDPAATHRELLDMETFSAYPAERIGTLDGVAEPELTFNYVNFHNFATLDDHEALQLLSESHRDQFHYAMNVFVSMDKSDRKLHFQINYDDARFEEKSVQRLRDHYVRLLAELSGDKTEALP